MSSIRIELEGDTKELIKKLEGMSQMDQRGILNAMAESVRTSTTDRFNEQTDPDGKKWKPSVRVLTDGGKTLTQTGQLRNSINTKVTDDGFVVGTNDIRAATHQFGDRRTIRPKNKKVLRFVVGGREYFTKKADVTIPARPFLGINKSDEEELIGTLEDYFEEQIND